MTKWYARSLLTAAFGAVAAPGFAAEAKEAPAAAAPDRVVPAQDAAVEVVPDVAYATADGDRQRLDLYLPKGRPNYPVVVFLHGGGFSKGDRKSAARFGEALARQGVGVAAAGYRLHPQVKPPEAAQDAARAVAWVKKNIAARGGDAGRVFLAGHSAGGLLAALVASDDRYLKAEGLAGGADVAGVVSLSGTYRVGEDRKEVFGDDDARKAASPISHVRAGLPPFLLVFADGDNPGKDKQTREYADALAGVKVEAAAVEAKSRNHGTLFSAIDAADPTGQAVVAFVKAHPGARAGAK